MIHCTVCGGELTCEDKARRVPYGWEHKNLGLCVLTLREKHDALQAEVKYTKQDLQSLQAAYNRMNLDLTMLICQQPAKKR